MVYNVVLWCQTSCSGVKRCVVVSNVPQCQTSRIRVQRFVLWLPGDHHNGTGRDAGHNCDNSVSRPWCAPSYVTPAMSRRIPSFVPPACRGVFLHFRLHVAYGCCQKLKVTGCLCPPVADHYSSSLRGAGNFCRAHFESCDSDNFND